MHLGFCCSPRGIAFTSLGSCGVGLLREGSPTRARCLLAHSNLDHSKFSLNCVEVFILCLFNFLVPLGLLAAFFRGLGISVFLIYLPSCLVKAS